MSFSFGFFDETSKSDATDTTAFAAIPAPAQSIRTDASLDIADDNGLNERQSYRSHVLDDRILDALSADGIPYTTIDIGGIVIHKTLKAQVSDLDMDSDIVTGVYEGGYKLWECSIDLAKYIISNSADIPTGSSGKSVIELGCGHGVPGIVASKMGFGEVIFSDLNAEVIEEVLLNNIILNTEGFIQAVQLAGESDVSMSIDCNIEADTNQMNDNGSTLSNGLKKILHDLQHSVKCYSGDWLSLSDHFGEMKKFDLILSAETIYSRESCSKLVIMLARHLAADGLALISTKRFYFGVGGGTAAFLEMLQQQAPLLRAATVQTYEDGASNIREILKINFR